MKANNNDPLNSASSWVNGIFPTGGVAIFDNTLTGPVSAPLGASASWLGIVGADAPADITITNTAGAVLSLGASGINLSQFAHTFTFQNRFTLTASQTWNTNLSTILTSEGTLTTTGANLSLTGDGIVNLTRVTGSGSLTLNGSNLLAVQLSGSNTYSGNTTILSGTLLTLSSNTLSSSSTVQLDNTGILDLRGASQTVRALSGTGGTITNTVGSATLVIRNAAILNAGARITGSIHLRAGRQRLSHTANTYTGTTTVTGVDAFGGNASGALLGVMQLADGGLPSSIGQSSSAPSNLVIDGIFEYDGLTPGSTDRLFTVGSTNGGTLTRQIASVSFTNTGPIAFTSPSGSGSLTLGGPNSFASTFAPQITGASTRLTADGNWKITNPANTYAGPTIIQQFLTVDKLANGGSPSSIGASTNAASNLQFSGGSLRYTGAGDATDRLISGTDGTIESSGAGPLAFTSTSNISISSLTLAGTNTQLNTFSGSLIGNAILIKYGSGTWVLNNTQNYSGDTVLLTGTLILDFSRNPAASVSALQLSGGELRINGAPGAAVAHKFSGLTVDGATAMGRLTGTLNGAASIIVELQSITRAAGSLDFDMPAGGSITTTAVNSLGILGAWASTSGTSWARVDNTQTIVPFTDYINDSWSGHTNITTSALVDAGTTNSLRFHDAPATLTLTGVNTLINGGILVTPNIAASSVAIVGGSLRSSTTKEIIIQQHNLSGAFEIASSIADSPLGASTLTKTGEGTLILSGANTYSGPTFLLAGTTQLKSSAALPKNGSLFLSGTLDLNGCDASAISLVSYSYGQRAIITNTALIPSTFTIGGTDSNLYFWGMLSSAPGMLHLRKENTGDLYFFNRQHYGGDTILAGGALYLSALGTLSDTGPNVLPVSSRLILDGGSLSLTVTSGPMAQDLDTCLHRSGESTLVSIGSFPIGPRLHIANLTHNPGATLVFAVTAAADGFAGILVDQFDGAPPANGPSGILGGWAIINPATIPTEFAVAYPTRNNAVGGGATYVNAFDDPTHNTSVSGAIIAVDGATSGSLRFSLSTASTLTLNGANVIGSGGILITRSPSSGSNRINAMPGASLTSGNGIELIVHDYSNTGGLQIQAPIVDNGPVSIGLTKSGQGTLTLSATNTYSGPTTINRGSVVFNANQPNLHLITGMGALTLQTSFTATADALTLATLTLNGSLSLRFHSAPAPVSKLNSLTIAGTTNNWTGKLDVANNPLILQPATSAEKTTLLARLTNQIVTGRHGGDWLGTGITSSTVAADQSATGSQNLTLALIDNADTPTRTTFGGQPVDANSLLITPALLGDADLSGIVDAADFDAWFRNVGQSSYSYAKGDFDHSGIIDAADFDAWFRHVGQSFSLMPDMSDPQSLQTSTVPEPASLSLLLLGLPLLRTTKRNRRQSLAACIR